MELAFKTKSLRSICEDEQKADKTIGLDASKQLRARLEDIRAAANITELAVGNPQVDNNSTEKFVTLTLYEEYVIKFSANHLSNPVKQSGDIDWSKVRRVKIEEISNRNE